MMEAHPRDAGVPLPERLLRLRKLALNLRWTWERETRALFRQIYPELWDQIVDNPWLVLQSASMGRVEALAADEGFCARLDEQYAELQRYMPGRTGSSRPIPRRARR